MKRLMICIAVSCLLMISCQSNRIIEYRTVLPNITFPAFPRIHRTVNEDGSWTIDKESVDLLAEYYIKISATEKTYKEIKKLLEEENEKSADFSDELE